MSDIDKTTFVMEAMAYLSHKMLRPVMYEASLKARVAYDKDCAAMIDIVFDTTYLDLNSIFNFGSSLTIARDSIFSETSYATQYAKRAKSISRGVERWETNFE